MPKTKSKPITAEDVDAAAAKKAATADKLETAKAAYRDAAEAHDAAAAQLAAQEAVANMTDTDRAAMAQALTAGGIASEEAVGTPNGGEA